MLSYLQVKAIISKRPPQLWNEYNLIRQLKVTIPLQSNIIPSAWIEVTKSEPPEWMRSDNMNILKNNGYTLAMWWLMKVNNIVPEWMRHDINVKSDDGETCLTLWVKFYKSEPPEWMKPDDVHILKNNGYTLAMDWLMNKNSNVPEWMQHDSNIKADNGETCLIIWIKKYKNNPPKWVLKNYNFNNHPFDYKSYWTYDKLSYEESINYNVIGPDWLIESRIEKELYYKCLYNLRKDYDIDNLTEVILHLRKFHNSQHMITLDSLDVLQHKMTKVKIIKYEDELYIKSISHPNFRPLKEYYGMNIKVPKIKWLKNKKLDDVCKLFDIIYNPYNSKIIEDSDIFKYFPDQLYNPIENNQYVFKLLHESDYKFIKKVRSVIPRRIIYDCHEIQGVNITHYMRHGLIKNKYKLSELFIKDIDYEFYDEYKHLIYIDDVESMKKIMQYYMKNKKPIPPEIINEM